MKLAALLAVAYLLGSIPTSLLLARLRGIDLREWGSGNLGATNLYRAAGPLPAVLCGVVDVGKGFVPAWFFPTLDDVGLPQLALAYGIAAVLGHVFSVWVGMRGGKGVATGAGVYLAIAPAAVGLGLALWVLIMFTVRIASVASLTAATLLPGLIWITGHGLDFVFWSSLPVAAFVWWTHRSNLRRLVTGEEPRTARGAGDGDGRGEARSSEAVGGA